MSLSSPSLKQEAPAFRHGVIHQIFPKEYNVLNVLNHRNWNLIMPKHSQSYFDYIHSPQWQARSAECIRKAGYKCQQCGNIGKLEVHHKVYKNLGNEKDDDLIAVCKQCHKEIHAQKQENKKK